MLRCLYGLSLALAGIVTQTHAASAPVSMGMAVVVVIGMPLRARRKQSIASVIGSGALHGDAAGSRPGAYMAAGRCGSGRTAN